MVWGIEDLKAQPVYWGWNISKGRIKVLKTCMHANCRTHALGHDCLRYTIILLVSGSPYRDHHGDNEICITLHTLEVSRLPKLYFICICNAPSSFLLPIDLLVILVLILA